MNDKKIETDFEKIKDYLDIDTYYDELSEFKNLLYEVFGDRVESQKYIVRANKKLEQLQSNWNSLREWLKEFKEYEKSEFQTNAEFYITVEEILDKMNELEGRDK